MIIDKLMNEINKTIDEYNKLNSNIFDNKTLISDSMVYRERKEVKHE